MQQHEFYDIFIARLEQSGIIYMVTGSVAAIIYGEPRLTHDIDIVLEIKANQIGTFVSLFPGSEYYCPPSEVIQVEIKRTQRAHFNLIHQNSGLKADCYPFTGDPLHRWALANSREISLPEKGLLKVAPPEYVIVRKLQYFNEGGSQKHLDDIINMIKISGDRIDRELLNGQIKQLGIEKYLDRINL